MHLDAESQASHQHDKLKEKSGILVHYRRCISKTKTTEAYVPIDLYLVSQLSYVSSPTAYLPN